MIILRYIGIVNSKSDMGRHNQLPTKTIGNLIFKFKGTKKNTMKKNKILRLKMVKLNNVLLNNFIYTVIKFVIS